jgi:hypothetical protein
LAVAADAERAEFLREERLINPVRSILRQRIWAMSAREGTESFGAHFPEYHDHISTA